MLDCFAYDREQQTIPIISFYQQDLFLRWLEQQEQRSQQWIKANGFNVKPGSICLIPDANGNLHTILFGVTSLDDFWAFGDLPNRLPPGNYYLEQSQSHLSQDQLQLALIAWALGSYRFSAYRQQEIPQAKILIQDMDQKLLQDLVAALYSVRDLINIPTEDLGPAELAEKVVNLANEFGAKISLIEGDDLLHAGYPAIHAVGRASTRPPRLIDLKWGQPTAKKLTLVGKGVCFDSGGLNIKDAANMRLMKKDMAGAAHALGLARLIMAQNLPFQLRVLIPAVENSIAGNSYRPGDVIATRAGIKVEISNTDAEGRVVLCDALTEAVSDEPSFIMDFSSLTGAARVALGPQIPVFFCNHGEKASQILLASAKVKDPIWQLPLYQPYREYLKSDIADIANSSKEPFAGAITAALYLQTFVPDRIPWIHFDFSAWNYSPSPGRPVGGEAMALRAMFEYLRESVS